MTGFILSEWVFKKVEKKRKKISIRHSVEDIVDIVSGTTTAISTRVRDVVLRSVGYWGRSDDGGHICNVRTKVSFFDGVGNGQDENFRVMFRGLRNRSQVCVNVHTRHRLRKNSEEDFSSLYFIMT